MVSSSRLAQNSSIHLADFWRVFPLTGRMDAGRKKEIRKMKETSKTWWTETCSVTARNLRKSDLCGVIFGCTYNTIDKCYSKQLFGLPATHFSHVENVSVGLPLFLLNYSDRKLHGIFEAASPGQMNNIDPCGWTSNGSDTPYAAQVKIRIRMHCQPLLEDQFKHVIAENYFNPRLFWVELDRDQTNKLISLFSSSPVIADTSLPSNTQNWSSLFKASSVQEGGSIEMLALEWDAHPAQVSAEWESRHAPDLWGGEALIDKEVTEKDEETGDHDRSYASVLRDLRTSFPQKRRVLRMASEAQMVLEMESSELQFLVAEQAKRDFKSFLLKKLQTVSSLLQNMVELRTKLQSIKEDIKILEHGSFPEIGRVTEKVDSSNEIHSDLDEKVLIARGYDGSLLLPAFNCYSPSRDLMESLCPMSFLRSHASAAKPNNEVYLFGGAYDNMWYNTGLPATHFSYVENVSVALPLFLFNYSDRKLHAIFEAASSGQMNIYPCGWTSGGSCTHYATQVKIRTPMHCQPLLEDQFKPIIAENYFKPRLFWVELDRDQTNKLISLFSFSPIIADPSLPGNTQKWSSLFKASSVREGGSIEMPALKWDAHPAQASAEWESWHAPDLWGGESLIDKEATKKDEETGDHDRSYTSVLRDVAEDKVEMDWLKKETCIICNRGGRVLACTETGCPFVFHENCTHGKPEFDALGRFYCPACLYKQAVVETLKLRKKTNLAKKACKQLAIKTRQSREKSMLARKAFLNFIDTIGENGQKQKEGEAKMKEPKVSRRKRLRWTAEEENILKEGVHKFSLTANKNLPWRKILEFGQHIFNEARTPVDLKDKWKNMLAKQYNH